MSKKPSKNKGMTSSFKASNIQTYAEGGEMDAAAAGPGHPFAFKKAMQNSSLYLSPLYTNSRGSAMVPGYMLGFGTGLAKPAKGGWSFTGRVGQEYEGAKALPFSYYSNNVEGNLHDSQAFSNSAYDQPEWAKALTPHTDDKNISFGLEADYRGPKMGERFTPLVELGFDRSKSGGVGAYMTGGGQFDWGDGRLHNGELRPGKIAGTAGIYGGVNAGTAESGFNYGVQGRAEWKPKVLKRTPLSVYGKGHLGGNTLSGLSYGAEVGLKAPMKQIQQIDIPRRDRSNMSDLIEQADENERNNELEQERFIPEEEHEYIPNETGGSTGWGKRQKVNASPVHKQWQPDANDIFIDFKNLPETPPFTFDPATGKYSPTIKEETESFAAGGRMYSGGGPIKPPKWSLGYTPYAYNAGNVIGGYEGFGNLTSQNLKLSTPDLAGREKNLNATRFPFSITTGKMYDENLTNDYATYGKTTKHDGYGNYEYKTPQEILDSKETPYAKGIPLDAEISFGVEGSGLNPNMKKRSRLGAQLEGGYNPTTGIYGQFNTKQKWALGNNYTNPLNRSGEWRVEPYISPLNFQITQKPTSTPLDSKYEEYLQGLVDSGSSYNPLDPNNPFQTNNAKTVAEGGFFASTGAGVDAQVKLPYGMLDAGVGVNYKLQEGNFQKFSPTAHLGYTLPLNEINLPERGSSRISLPERSPFRSMSVANDAGTRYDNSLFEKDKTPQEGIQKANASPVHKQWQPEAEDIFIDWKNQPTQAPFTYDPATGESQPTEEMNNYSKGGQVHINFANGGSFNNKGFRSLPANVQAKIRSNSFAAGGQLTEFNEGGTHEESPLGGIPQGMAPDGKLNLVEQGETKLNTADYIFSDQIKVDKDTATLYGLPKGDIGKTFADVSKKLNRPNSRRDNDTIEQVAIQRDLENLMQAQEKQKEIQKNKDIEEFAAKYPELAQNMPVPGQEQQMAPQQQMMGQPQMAPNPMEQGMMQEQMNPPANMPQQQVDPAMMAQMQQMQQMGQMPMSYGGSIFNCGGKMYNNGGYMYDAGGHMYAVGGNFLRGIGSAAYGAGEGLLDTLTFGLTDTLTDKGFDKLAGMGGRSQSEIEKDRMIRGFGNAAGAIGGAALTGGATTSAALNEGIEGVTSGVTNIKGTDEKFDRIAGGIGQGASMIAGFMGPEGATQAAGVFKGNEAVNKLMAAKQNPFINQATNFAAKAFADGGNMNYSMYQPFDHVTQYGGPLNAPTANHPYLNYLAGGGNMEGENPETKGSPRLAFNLNGIVANYTLEQAQADPLILETFGADVDPKTGALISNENLEAAKLAIEERFNEESISNRQAVGLAQQEYDNALNAEANIGGTADNNTPISTERLPGETDEQYARRLHTMKMNLDQKQSLGNINQTPLEGALMALPAAYNIGRGIFGKPNVLDYNEYAQKANIEPYTMNVDPQLAETRKAYAGAAQAIKNASPGSGAYLTNMANVASNKQEDINALLTKKEMFDKEAKYKTDMANREINNSNLDLKMKLQTYNDAAKAAKAKSLQEGLGQLADIAKNEQGITLQEALLKLTSPDYAEKFNYSSLFEQLQKAAKAKKSTTAGK
jgi:hypothetical protein